MERDNPAPGLRGGVVVVARGVGSGRGGIRWSPLVRSELGDVLPVARSVDVDADGVHREAVEDCHRDGGVAEVAAPVAEVDVGRDGGRHSPVPAVDEVEQRVRRRGLRVALLHLPESHVVNDEELWARPRLEAPRVRPVGEAGV